MPVGGEDTARAFFGELLGLRVRITGEEGIDARWPNTPVLLIKSLDVIP